VACGSDLNVLARGARTLPDYGSPGKRAERLIEGNYFNAIFFAWEEQVLLTLFERA